jgi:large subunit ribosomal protein L35
MKTRRGAAKRFKKTGGGKIRRAKAFKNHMLTKKSSKRKRNLRAGGLVSSADEPAIRQQLPNL